MVWGFGGAGKSQLVLNFIREYRRDYAVVFWIEAGSKESIERDYIQIYRLLYSRKMDAGQVRYSSQTVSPRIIFQRFNLPIFGDHEASLDKRQWNDANQAQK